MSVAEVVQLEVVARSGWRSRANCIGHTELFFARRAERPQARRRREDKAAKLCGACPVEQECREFARRHHEYGFWGGESEEERHLAGYTLAAPIGTRARRERGTPARRSNRRTR